jgi:transposase
LRTVTGEAAWRNFEPLARLEFLPPYSPELNLIEEAWSKVKTFLRMVKARTFDMRCPSSAALVTVTPVRSIETRAT